MSNADQRLKRILWNRKNCRTGEGKKSPNCSFAVRVCHVEHVHCSCLASEVGNDTSSSGRSGAARLSMLERWGKPEVSETQLVAYHGNLTLSVSFGKRFLAHPSGFIRGKVLLRSSIAFHFLRLFSRGRRRKMSDETKHPCKAQLWKNPGSNSVV